MQDTSLVEMPLPTLPRATTNKPLKGKGGGTTSLLFDKASGRVELVLSEQQPSMKSVVSLLESCRLLARRALKRGLTFEQFAQLLAENKRADELARQAMQARQAVAALLNGTHQQQGDES